MEMVLRAFLQIDLRVQNGNRKKNKGHTHTQDLKNSITKKKIMQKKWWYSFEPKSLAKDLTPVTPPDMFTLLSRSVLAAACRVLVPRTPTAAALVDTSKVSFVFFFVFARAARSVKGGFIDRARVDHSGQSAHE